MDNKGQKKYKTTFDAIKAYNKPSVNGQKGSNQFAMLDLQVQEQLERDLASLAENNGVPAYDY